MSTSLNTRLIGGLLESTVVATAIHPVRWVGARVGTVTTSPSSLGDSPKIIFSTG
jgi:hypothetical protein